METSASAQCLGMHSPEAVWTRFRALGLHPVCSGSQQTLGLLALGKPDTQNLSYAYAPYRTTQVRRRIDDLFRTR